MQTDKLIPLETEHIGLNAIAAGFGSWRRVGGALHAVSRRRVSQARESCMIGPGARVAGDDRINGRLDWRIRCW